MTSNKNLALQRKTLVICGKHSRSEYPLANGHDCQHYLPSAPQLLYHFPVQDLASQLLRTIRKQHSLRAGDRVAAAVSGGSDSVALLHLLLQLRAELGIVLSVAHVNHKLRGSESGSESDEDERFVTDLAQRHDLELHVIAAPVIIAPTIIPPITVAPSSSAKSSGIEAAARELRYNFFRQLARDGRVNKIATAHTLDDQAETVLLRLFRGTGIRGLSGIHPRIVFEEQGRVFGELVRPLLSFRRAALNNFLLKRNQDWREDSSNRDTAFLRNRVRHRLLPLITAEFGGASIEHMADLAEIARAEEEHWDCAHPELLEEIQTSETRSETRPAPCLQAEPLLALPLAAQRRLMRLWLEANAKDWTISFHLIEEALELVRGDPGKKLELHPGQILRRNRHGVSFEIDARAGAKNASAKNSSAKSAHEDYEHLLLIPGKVVVPQLGASFEAQIIDRPDVPNGEHAQLLNPHAIPKQVVIRNWRAGDRYWPAHTAAPRKVKELLSDRHATGSEKKLWPVAVAEDGVLIWMRGFAAPVALRAPVEASSAVWIRELRS
jgi:tRNA(Ile)-lysidine synthase